MIACKMSVEETCKHIGADSLAYLSISALSKIAEGTKCGMCDACFTGKYPVYVPQENNR